MNVNFEKAMAELMKDKELCEKFAEAKELKEKYEILKPFAKDLSFEDFEKDFSNSTKETLSADDLEEVAGGLSNTISKNAQAKIQAACDAGDMSDLVFDALRENGVSGVALDAVEAAIKGVLPQARSATTYTELGKALATGVIDGLVAGRVISASLGAIIKIGLASVIASTAARQFDD